MSEGAKHLQRRDVLSAEEISSRFFRSRLTGLQGLTSQSKPDLTASTKYIVREAKKRLGQQNALGARIQPQEDDLMALIRLVEEEEGEELSPQERTAALAVLVASLDHYDILTPLIDNPEINDIIIRAFNDISVQSNRTNYQTDLCFPDQDTYKSFVENLLKRAGKSCTVGTPVVDAAIDPHVRACVTHESFSPPGSGPLLTLRIARHNIISLERLAHFELAPQEILEFLSAVVEFGCGTLLVAGEVGTGKTTLVKALTSRIPESEAILIIEDTHELVLSRRFVRTLLTREANTEGAGRISPAMAIRAGMRMAMNRLILGEMRDAEAAEAFIDVCASGHAGMSTIHSRSAKDAIARLELFLSRAQPGVGMDTIRRQIANAVSVLVFLGVDATNRKRHIVEVMEIGAFADGAIQLSPLYRHVPGAGVAQWRRDSGVSIFSDLLRSRMKMSLPGTTLSLDVEQLYQHYSHENIS